MSNRKGGEYCRRRPEARNSVLVSQVRAWDDHSAPTSSTYMSERPEFSTYRYPGPRVEDTSSVAPSITVTSPEVNPRTNAVSDALSTAIA